MGAQDMKPKRQPSLQEVESFLRRLNDALGHADGAKFFGNVDAAVGTYNQYHDVIIVEEWLQSLVKEKLLFDDPRRRNDPPLIGTKDDIASGGWISYKEHNEIIARLKKGEPQ